MSEKDKKKKKKEEDEEEEEEENEEEEEGLASDKDLGDIVDGFKDKERINESYRQKGGQ